MGVEELTQYETCCSRLFVSLLTAQRPCHWIALSTDPFAENGGTSTAVLSAPANASNVSIICNISFQGTPFALDCEWNEDFFTRHE